MQGAILTANELKNSLDIELGLSHGLGLVTASGGVTRLLVLSPEVLDPFQPFTAADTEFFYMYVLNFLWSCFVGLHREAEMRSNAMTPRFMQYMTQSAILKHTSADIEILQSNPEKLARFVEVTPHTCLHSVFDTWQDHP
jgi:hypothetical protein